jgi:signal transduction histidine kinase
MNTKTDLKPGLINTYRLLSWVLVGISIFQVFSHLVRIPLSDMAIHPVWILPYGNILILCLLYWPWAMKSAGKYFVPLLVVLATLGSILRTYLISMIRIAPTVTISILIGGTQDLLVPVEMYELNLIMASWQLIPLLFIPLIMVAWQYDFKAVVAFIFGATLLDTLIYLSFLSGSGTVVSMISMAGVWSTRTLTFLVVGFLVSRMMAAQRQQQNELKQANQELLGYTMTLEQLTTTRERNRLARELHDTLAHTLSSLSVQLNAVQSLWEKDKHAAQQGLNTAIFTTRSGLDETRRALKALRTAPLEDLGLCLAINEMAQSAADRCGAALSIQIPEIPFEIPPNQSQAFYRAAQEALENIVRHSEAAHITLRLTNTEDILTLKIVDDGVGFDPQRIPSDTYGLRGLRERAALIGGVCIIDSHPGQGTSILFRAGVTHT